MLTIGLVVNPYAGIGGAQALEGSDGSAIREQALASGDELRAPGRVMRALEPLLNVAEQIHFLCWGGAMGADYCEALGLSHELVGATGDGQSEADDTRAAVSSLQARSVDLLLFAGGDGTARDVLDALSPGQVALGIPCGVKMHSGVFAVSPEAAGELLLRLAHAGLVNLSLREVRDIDEDLLREGSVKTRFYGEMLVPEEGHFLQHTKIAGVESDELVARDIAESLLEEMEADVLYLIGPGSTTFAIKQAMGIDGSLLGVDVVQAGELLLADATAAQLEALDVENQRTRLIVTAIGGQGHVIGRGNLQLSPALLARLGPESLCIVAGKGKISALGGRPLLLDTNDAELDRAFSGYRRIITGYQDEILYPLEGTAQ